MSIVIHCPNASCKAATNVAVASRGVNCKTCGTWISNVPSLDVLPFPTLPAEFGRYRVLSLLGRGGMGAVYLAEDTQLARKVALKLPSFDASESKRLERFVREAKSSAGLLHPNICPVFDAGSIAGRPYISMAYINGKSLEEEFDPDRPMEVHRAIEIVRKVAAALQDAHENNIVHRDLKPANVMMSAKGEPIVMDFGLALRVSEIDENETKLTKHGEVARRVVPTSTRRAATTFSVFEFVSHHHHDSIKSLGSGFDVKSRNCTCTPGICTWCSKCFGR